MPGFIVTVTPAGVAEAEARLRQRLAAILDGSEPATPDSERNTRTALAKVERKVSRQTVDTLAYAIDHVVEPAANDLAAAHLASLEVDPDSSLSLTERIAAQQPRVDAEAAWRRADAELRALPESGGSVSLPDGSTITVEPAGGDA